MKARSGRNSPQQTKINDIDDSVPHVLSPLRSGTYSTVSIRCISFRPSIHADTSRRQACLVPGLDYLRPRERESIPQCRGRTKAVDQPTRLLSTEKTRHPTRVWWSQNLTQVHSPFQVTPWRGCRRGKPADDDGELGPQRPFRGSGGASWQVQGCCRIRAGVPESQACAYLAVCVGAAGAAERQTDSVILSARFFSVMEDELGG